jgi:hypothetical protein
MNRALRSDAGNAVSASAVLPIIGIVIAIAATTTMDANGLSAFSAFALLPLTLLFWYLERNRLRIFRFRLKNRCARYSQYRNLRSRDRRSRLSYQRVVCAVSLAMVAMRGSIERNLIA